MAKITKDMLIGEIVGKYPETAPVMMESGLHCAGCGVAGQETVEQGCQAHGMKKEDIDKMVKEMNDAVDGEEGDEEE